jgi:hypothetical protein
MPASEARVAANRRNAQLSTGPKTEEGKEQSRANSIKHGLTGAGVVLLASDAAEIKRRTGVYGDELGAFGEVGEALARRMALHSVRMERAANQQAAAMQVHLKRVEAEFVVTEGATEAEAAAMLAETLRAAMFDPSKEAILAHRYEMAAERGFYRAIKQLRQLELQGEAMLKADAEAQSQDMVASFLKHIKEGREIEADLDAMEAKYGVSKDLYAAKSAHVPQAATRVEVPITIGKPR